MNDDEIVQILLIDDSEADAQIFRLSLTQCALGNFELIHAKSPNEAIKRLSTMPSPPYMVCIDLDGLSLSNQELSRLVDAIGRYGVPADSVIGLAGNDSKTSIRRALEVKVGDSNVIRKADAWKLGEEHEILLESIRRIVANRSSGRTREMQMDVVRMTERVDRVISELRSVESKLDKIYATLFEGGAGSLVAIALRYQQKEGLLASTAELDALKKELQELKKGVSEFENQVHLRRLDLVYGLLSKAGLGGLFFLFFLVFLITVGTEQAIELIKLLVEKF